MPDKDGNLSVGERWDILDTQFEEFRIVNPTVDSPFPTDDPVEFRAWLEGQGWSVAAFKLSTVYAYWLPILPFLKEI